MPVAHVQHRSERMRRRTGKITTVNLVIGLVVQLLGCMFKGIVWILPNKAICLKDGVQAHKTRHSREHER